MKKKWKVNWVVELLFGHVFVEWNGQYLMESGQLLAVEFRGGRAELSQSKKRTVSVLSAVSNLKTLGQDMSRVLKADWNTQNQFFQAACLEGFLRIVPNKGESLVIVAGESTRVVKGQGEFAPQAVGVNELQLVQKRLGFKYD